MSSTDLVTQKPPTKFDLREMKKNGPDLPIIKNEVTLRRYVAKLLEPFFAALKARTGPIILVGMDIEGLFSLEIRSELQVAIQTELMGMVLDPQGGIFKAPKDPGLQRSKAIMDTFGLSFETQDGKELPASFIWSRSETLELGRILEDGK